MTQIPNCYVVRVNICDVGIGYEIQTNAPFVLSLNNQRCLPAFQG